MLLSPVRRVLVDLGSILKNLNYVRESFGLSPDRIVAVVKEDAYGHGAEKVIPVLYEGGVRSFAFASVDEAVRFYPSIPSGSSRVFILGGLRELPEAEAIEEYGFIPVISDYSMLELVKGRRVDYFLKFDTGMGRLGFLPGDAEEVCSRIKKLSLPNPVGVISHLSCAGEDNGYTLMQVELFTSVVSILEAKFGRLERQIANSSYLFSGLDPLFDAVRLGIVLYGSPPLEGMTKSHNLSEAMSFVSRIWQVKFLRKGSRISYGGTHVLKKDSIVAVVPVGYAHGYSRLLSGKSKVILGDALLPVIGRVTMDWIMVDVSDVPGCSPGSEVILLGSSEHVRISAWDIARWMGTIPYEVYCLFGTLNRREYIGP